MAKFYIADLHIGDPRQLHTMRGFSTVSQHDLFLKEQWRFTVGETDEVWFLGDLAFRFQEGLDWIAGLPGVKHLISGNFDRCHPMFRDSHVWQKEYLKHFESVQFVARHRINDTSVLLSHYPYRPNAKGPRKSMQYRLYDEGLWLLHGHDHSRDIRRSSREIHVGWDAWRRFVTEQDIADQMLIDY